MIATVQELIEELENYGGHLPVRILLAPIAFVSLQKRDDDAVHPLVINDTVIDGETTVVLEVEVLSPGYDKHPGDGA
jgi:hypothetical protein